MDIVAPALTLGLIVGPILIWQWQRKRAPVGPLATDEQFQACLVARYSRSRISGLVVELLFFDVGALGGWYVFVSAGMRVHQVVGGIMFSTFVIICSALLILWCHRLLLCDGNEVITVDARGIRDRRRSEWIIPWSVVTSVTEAMARGGRLTGVRLVLDFTRTDGPPAGWPRHWLNGAPLDLITVTTAGLDLDSPVLLAAVKYHLTARRPV